MVGIMYQLVHQGKLQAQTVLQQERLPQLVHRGKLQDQLVLQQEHLLQLIHREKLQAQTVLQKEHLQQLDPQDQTEHLLVRLTRIILREMLQAQIVHLLEGQPPIVYPVKLHDQMGQNPELLHLMVQQLLRKLKVQPMLHHRQGQLPL